MKLLFRLIRPPVMLLGLIVELLITPLVLAIRFVEEHTDKEAK